MTDTTEKQSVEKGLFNEWIEVNRKNPEMHMFPESGYDWWVKKIIDLLHQKAEAIRGMKKDAVLHRAQMRQGGCSPTTIKRNSTKDNTYNTALQAAALLLEKGI